MQMNKLKQLMLISLPMLILLAVSYLPQDLAAQDNEQPVPANPVPVTEEPRQTPAEPETDSGEKPTPTAPARATKPIKNFKPSETIGADSAVAFPIDI
jgi:hypothetical protein